MEMMLLKKKQFRARIEPTANQFKILSFRRGLTDRAISDTLPTRISTNENYFLLLKVQLSPADGLDNNQFLISSSFAKLLFCQNENLENRESSSYEKWGGIPEAQRNE